jgi:hypothetical protein
LGGKIFPLGNCGAVQTLLLQLPDFSVDSLHTSGDHLTIELIHLAVVVQVKRAAARMGETG